MNIAADLISPKQVAKAIGVSESSLKRWCDQGLIETIRTGGGHRKISIAAVLQFVREHNHQIGSPEILGLPPVSPDGHRGLAGCQQMMVEALLAGDELLARQIVFDLYLEKHSLSFIFDDVLAPAFREIGDRWACHQIEIYQERRSCEIALSTLFDLRRVQQIPDKKWGAIVATIEGDQYSVASAMATLVLRDAGFFSTTLGTSIPFNSLIAATMETRPTVFCLSVSHIGEEIDFVREFAALAQACSTVGAALVVGGRALTHDLRQRMTYSAFCDTMRHLDGFARTLFRSLSQGESRSSRNHSGLDGSAAKEISKSE